MPATLIIAEKPSVAKDIARVIGATRSESGFFSGNEHQVTWAFGHLVALPEPHEINPEWKKWRAESLPMFPRAWPLKVVEETRSQFKIIQALLKSAAKVICATDAGREGELIFRYILEAAKLPAKSKPAIQRLWISSLTPQAIRAGLESLRDIKHYDHLADAAKARSRADWLVGMNFSRAYALSSGEPLFVGRVQTPTLALVVNRDLEIRNFKPETYQDLTAEFDANSGEEGEVELYSGSYLGEKKEISGKKGPFQPKRLPLEGEVAAAVRDRVKKGKARVASVESKTNRQLPPFLYDLTELQRHANRLFGFSAAKTLELAQALYEKHKLLSYPRTDSRHLTQAVAETLPRVVSIIRAPYEELLSSKTGRVPLGSRYVDDSQVGDHHAIIPTEIPLSGQSLDSDETRIYDLVCRRLLSAWQEDHITSVTTVLTEVEALGEAPGVLDVFRTQGTVIQEMGWKRLDPWPPKQSPVRKGEGEKNLPSGLEEGLGVVVLDAVLRKKTTEPPPHLTEATLLTGMETAGRNLEDKELAKAMREAGLGTPATRASIIETLLARGYIERSGKALIATSLGERLIETVHASVKSPELTARWERDLSLIQAGRKAISGFMSELEKEIEEVLAKISHNPASNLGNEKHPPARLLESSSLAEAGTGGVAPRVSPPVTSETPRVPTDLKSVLKERFGFENFRPHQEEVCKAVTSGADVLLVMPTGAGKSLCYQLPGIARGGTTLVISPLVALIDDQSQKLRSLGMRADRIHSGRSRQDSRAACVDYLSGRLDFLFVAPERLALPGFIEMLKKRRPSLIAIDEAHCISQWGHDFRPNYRLLGERLKEFRPVPVVALTATATPRVQDDIAGQLGFSGEKRFIQGFRRKNIAIQVLSVPPSQRGSAVLTLLKSRERCPAIVYAPTRKAAESLCEELKTRFSAEVYHAGMSASSREKTQELYLSGKLDLIVATVAFGMGIDKADVRTVIHAGLPGSLEGYYQEIGRAGRDGLPSQAFLLHSFADQKTHEFFFERDYPEISVLKKIFEVLDVSDANPVPKAVLQGRLKFMDRDTFDKALEKLWIHQGAVVDAEENVSRGAPGWERTYHAQSEHKRQHLREMVSFAESTGCRMTHLIRHFGDRADREGDCGICDMCRPDAAPFRIERRAFTRPEQELAARIMAILEGRNGLAVGRVFSDLQESQPKLERRKFEEILNVLAGVNWVGIEQASFERSGERISYRKVFVTEKGGEATAEDLAALTTAGESSFSPGSFAGSGKSKRKRNGKPGKRGKAKITYSYGDSSGDISSTPLFESLRAWRLTHARTKGIPAFRILSDRVLEALCESRPRDSDSLLEVQGIGPKLAGQYGAEILEIINTARS